MIHLFDLFDTNVVAELTTRAKPDQRVLAWFGSTVVPTAS